MVFKVKAIIDYNMIQNGDSIVVGISGKDSIALLFFRPNQKYSPFDFNIVAVYGFGIENGLYSC